ncbi:MAG TPA: FAD-binding protein [Ktedonobacteraceae bacterium]|jgi:electron transfer flavoprotein alpha subunit
MAQISQSGTHPLKILVCLKQVPLLSALRFDPETRRLLRSGVPLEMNELDVYALTEAIRLREQHGGEVIALTMGPPQAHSALATALAMGANRAIHLNDRAFAGADTLATARALATAIQSEHCDLIFCGRHSIDAETSQVGPEIAEMLDIPQVSAIQQIELQQHQNTWFAQVTRETDEGSETLRVSLPALFTAAEKLNEGIWPDEQAIQEAGEWHERYTTQSAADLALNLDRSGASGSPTWVASIEPDLSSRSGRVINEAEPAMAIDLLLADLREHHLLTSADQTIPAGIQIQRAQREGAPRTGKAVWVVAEMSERGVRRVTLELLGKARELAARLQGEVAALLIGGPDVREHAATLTAYGAEKIYLAAHPALAYYTTEGYATVLAEAIQCYQPAIVLLGSTANGCDLAPRVAARLALGLTGDCIDLAIDEQQRLVQYKPAFGNQIISAILSRTSPAMATLRPGMLQAIQPDTSRQAQIELLPVEHIAARIRTEILRQQSTATGVEKLETARIVLGIGMGMGEPEHYAQVYRLAEVLQAAIGVTRNVADQGWLPKQLQIGLTGRAIAPALYLALGIRGASEHIAGIRKAGYVVAINKNKRAAIFRHANVGVVGDVHVLLPLLLARLEREMENGTFS